MVPLAVIEGHRRLIQRLTAQTSTASLAILAVFLPVIGGILGGIPMSLSHSRLRGTSNFHIDDGRQFRYGRVTQIILCIPNQAQVKLPPLLSVAIRRGGRMEGKASSCVYSPESAEDICSRIRMLIPLIASAPLETKPGVKPLMGSS
jgi:hypothetical protein